MDFKTFEIGGVSVIVLVLGIVEASKRWGLKGTWLQVFSFGLGFVLVGLSATIGAGLIPETAVPWIVIAVYGLGGALAANGLHDFTNRAMTRLGWTLAANGTHDVPYRGGVGDGPLQ